jgi:hypothetical protein
MWYRCLIPYSVDRSNLLTHRHAIHTARNRRETKRKRKLSSAFCFCPNCIVIKPRRRLASCRYQKLAVVYLATEKNSKYDEHYKITRKTFVIFSRRGEHQHEVKRHDVERTARNSSKIWEFLLKYVKACWLLLKSCRSTRDFSSVTRDVWLIVHRYSDCTETAQTLNDLNIQTSVIESQFVAKARKKL